jgi:hypothetical protein
MLKNSTLRDTRKTILSSPMLATETRRHRSDRRGDDAQPFGISDELEVFGHLDRGQAILKPENNQENDRHAHYDLPEKVTSEPDRSEHAITFGTRPK